jgi:hypothetical protein
MEKETNIYYLHIQDNGEQISLELPFTISPNVGDYVSYVNPQGEVQFLIVTRRLFSSATNNLIITLKTN